MKSSDTWLIIPLYNEQRIIEDVVRGALDVFPNIVCVDDGSSDNSAAMAVRAGARLVRHPVNLGQGAALQTGIEYARTQDGARYFVTFDADGQHKVSDAEQMIEKLRSEKLDIVVGTRFGSQRVQVPVVKRFMLRTVVMLSPTIRALHLTDAHNGLRAFNWKVAAGMALRSSGMGHASEIARMIKVEKWRLAEMPVEIMYTEYSMAKGQSLINSVNIAFESFVRMSLRGR